MHREDVSIVVVDLSCLESQNEQTQYQILPDKTLFNIGMDMASTDMIVLVPPSVTLNNVNGKMHDEIKKQLLQRHIHTAKANITRTTARYSTAMIIPV